jgi:hypothetical protein
MSVYLGIDVGTSGTKTLAVRSDGKILASATADYPLSNPRPGWSEQDPEDWWQATVKSVRAVLKQAKLKSADVSGIGLSGQMHGSVFLDGRQQVIRPAILWNDQRTSAECAEIEARAGGRSQLIELVANPALTGFTAPKILWLRKHEPKHFDHVRHVLLPKDYVRLRLTGEFATEVSDASGTLLLDVRKRRWCKTLLDLLQLDVAILQPVYESEEVSGKLSAAAGKLLGLQGGVPVVGGGGDQAAGAVGNGIVRAGVISATMGTSGVVFAHSDAVQYDPQGRLHTFCHAVRGTWHVMGVVLSAGGGCRKTPEGRSLRAHSGPGRTGPTRLRGSVLSSLSHWRTHASCRPACAGSVGGPDAAARSLASRAIDFRRGDVCHARFARNHQADASPSERGSSLGGRRPESVLAADAGRYLWGQIRDDEFGGRTGLWRGTAGGRRNRRFQVDR